MAKMDEDVLSVELDRPPIRLQYLETTEDREGNCYCPECPKTADGLETEIRSEARQRVRSNGHFKDL